MISFMNLTHAYTCDSNNQKKYEINEERREKRESTIHIDTHTHGHVHVHASIHIIHIHIVETIQTHTHTHRQTHVCARHRSMYSVYIHITHWTKRNETSHSQSPDTIRPLFSLYMHLFCTPSTKQISLSQMIQCVITGR